jgi:hypothetical protein
MHMKASAVVETVTRAGLEWNWPVCSRASISTYAHKGVPPYDLSIESNQYESLHTSGYDLNFKVIGLG